MVWGQREFAREIHRMLVELASIKKRLPASPEVLERIERLETSHHNLLRKLSASLRARRSSKGKAPQRGPRLDVLRALDRQLRSLAEVSESRPRRLTLERSEAWTTGTEERGRGGLRGRHIHRRSLDLEAAGGGSPDGELPGPEQKCASCGKHVLVSLYSGEEIVLCKSAWYHRRCFRGRRGRGPWLN